MVAVHSTMVPLGTPAPDFALPDPMGRVWTLDQIAADAPATVVVFLSNHCPYVRRIAAGLGVVAADLAALGVAIVGIMSNDVDAYPDDAPEHMAARADEWGWRFPYLVDASQEVARAYHAACTPDFFVFDGRRRLAYRGQLDDARPGNDLPVTGADLRAAVAAVVAGTDVPGDQLPSMGCSIKWRPGTEPPGFG